MNTARILRTSFLDYRSFTKLEGKVTPARQFGYGFMLSAISFAA